MEENQQAAAGGLEHDLVLGRHLMWALGLGAIPAVLAWVVDDRAFQTWDLPVAAAILVFALLLVSRAHPKPLRSFPWIVGLAVAMVPPLVTMLALDGPITNDERAYEFQAGLLAAGEVAESLPHAVGVEVDDDALLQDVFRRRQVFEDPATDRRYSKYAPGTSFALLPGVVVGLPLLSTLLAALLDLWLIRLIAQRLRLRVPGMAVLLLGTSPFFLLLHTSMQSQVFTMPAALFGYYALLRVRGGALPWAVAVGAAAGCVFLARPLTGVVVAVALGIALLQHTQRWRSIPLAILGGLPFLVFTLLWNQEFSGDLWTPTYSMYAEKYGPFFPGPDRLPQDVYGNGDLLTGLLRQGGRWSVAFGGMLGAIALGFWGTWRLRTRDGGAAVLLSSLLPLAYSLHWYAGHRAYLGPLYAAESLALLLLGLLLLLEQAHVSWRRGLLLAMVSCGGIVFTVRWSLIQEESFARSAPQRVVAAETDPDAGAVVFLPLKYRGSKALAYKYWTPSLPSEVEGGGPLILRTTRQMSPQRIVQWLELEGRPLYGYVPSDDAPLGGYLQPLEFTGAALPQR
ncbi:MAG: hypothetical protein ACYTEP_05820 [Planctomycetota bacterium]|jgi:hypothetical protein